MGTNLGVLLVMVPFTLFIFMLPIALLVALQVWLCKKSLKLGLILPGISLALSLVIVFSIAAFGMLTVTAGNTPVHIEGGANYMVGPDGLEVPAQEGDYIEVPAQEGTPRGETEFPVSALITAGVLFLVMNIPTAVFGGIWLHYKGRRDTIEDLKRMQIEDLG